MKSKLAYYLCRGIDLKDACYLAKCSKRTLDNLRNDVDFDDFVQECIARSEEFHVSNINECAMDDWKASAWFLERRFPDKYGKKDQIRHEYTLKINTFQKVVFEILDELDPKLKFQILQRMRTYEYNGDHIADRQIKPIQIEENTSDDSEVIDV
ncbi:MAG: hypothetical protein RBR32_03615 [Bacteroidales bacterium]|nr:hypothetical protein [Bacteroidales bacterium]